MAIECRVCKKTMEHRFFDKMLNGKCHKRCTECRTFTKNLEMESESSDKKTKSIEDGEAWARAVEDFIR